MKSLQLALVFAGVMLAFNLPAQTTTVAVKVLDASGKPMPGVTVESRSLGDAIIDLDSVSKETKTTTTDSNGMVHVAMEGEWGQVVAHKTGLAVAGSYCGPSLFQSVDLTLYEPVAVSGVVVDENDKPVGGARVSVNRIVYSSSQGGGLSSLNAPFLEPYLSARTGTDGRFHIEGVPTNSTVDFAVVKHGKALVRPAQDKLGSAPVMGRAGQQDIKLKMQPAASLEGQFQAEGEGVKLQPFLLLTSDPPQPGWLVPHVKPGADGRFVFEDLEPGSYRIVTHYGRGTPEWVAPPQAVSLAVGQAKRDVKITVTKGGFLEARVVSTAEHKPVADVSVSTGDPYLESIGNTGEGKTGADGIAILRLYPGSHQVSAFLDGAQSKETSVQIEEGKTNRVELELPPSRRIHGTVRDTNGAPVVGLEVRVYPDFFPALTTTTTDTNGHFSLMPLDLGVNQGAKPFVIVRDFDRNLAAAQNLEEGTKNYVLQLAPALVLAGRVQDEQGKPLTNAGVTIVGWSGTTGWFLNPDRPPRVDAQGHFEMGALPRERRYSVDVSAKGYGAASSGVEDSDTNRFELQPFVLKVADEKIAGVVVDLQDKPVKGARVNINGAGQPDGYADTDENGRFAFDQVCAGTITVGAYTSGGSSLYGSARVEAGDTNIVITLGRQVGMAPQRPPRAALVGLPLPDLTGVGIASDLLVTNKPMLICLFDPEQRPSRRVVRLLSNQNDALKRKGVTVVGISAALTTVDALKEWKQSNLTPFAVGGVTENNDKTKWILNTERFPWLILTDALGRVAAEGFELDELDGKLK